MPINETDVCTCAFPRPSVLHSGPCQQCRKPMRVRPYSAFTKPVEYLPKAGKVLPSIKFDSPEERKVFMRFARAMSKA